MKLLNITPLSNKVICQTIKQDEKTTQSGLIIPANENSDINFATVIAAGPGEFDTRGVFTPMTVKSGDKVAYARFGGNFFRVGEEEYFVIREHELIGVINE